MSEKKSISLSNRKDIDRLGKLRRAWGCDSDASTVCRAMEVAESLPNDAANAQAEPPAELVQLKYELELELQTNGPGRDYMVKVCGILDYLGDEYPDLRESMDIAEAAIIARI